jgi:iron complex outermembrane receptor protein
VPESLLKTNRTFNSAGTERTGDAYNNETDNYQQDHYQFFFNHSINDHLSFNTAFFLTKGQGYYEQYKAGAKFSSYGLPDVTFGTTTITKTDLVRQLWLDNDFYGQLFSFRYKKPQNELTVGGGWNTYDGEHFGKIIWSETGIPKDHRWYDLDALKKDKNVFVKWQHDLNSRWHTFIDLQFRHVDYTINGFRNNPSVNISRSFNFLNPKGGVTYTLNGWKGYLSYALANKEPNRDDYEASMKEQPKHETLHDFELGIERNNKLYTWRKCNGLV